MSKVIMSIKTTVSAVFVGLLICGILFSGTAYAAALPNVTTKSYDMDEYLNMLVSTGQTEKYEKFAKIANQNSLAKHTEWLQNSANNVWTENANYATLIDVVKAKAKTLGFDALKDEFTLEDENRYKALIGVVHQEQKYYVVLQKNGNGYWFVDYVYTIRN